LFLQKDNIRYDKTDLVGSYNFLDTDEVRDVKEKIIKITSASCQSEISRNSVMSTIGIPLYVDGANKHLYNIRKDRYNQLLEQNFGWIYQKLLKKLEYITDKRCKYVDELSLPGFHVFKAGSWLGSGWSVASLHVDKQFDYIQGYNNLDKTDVFSFTVGITLPKKSGLYIYNCTENDINVGYWPFYTYFKNKPRYKVYYEVGKLYFHDGLHYHMISEFDSKNTDRITLQGHGIWNKDKNEYIIYW